MTDRLQVDDNVVTLNVVAPPAPSPNEAVVALLKEVLAEAEAGEIKAVIIIGVDKDDDSRKGFAGDLRLSHAIGLLEYCKHSLFVANDVLEGEE